MQSSKLPLSTQADTVQAAVLPAKYAQQMGITFVDDFICLAYNVTAIAQTDPYGYGPPTSQRFTRHRLLVPNVHLL